MRLWLLGQDSLLDEVVASAQLRCVEPVAMDTRSSLQKWTRGNVPDEVVRMLSKLRSVVESRCEEQKKKFRFD